MTLQSICVYCGSNLGLNPAYRDMAIKLGHSLASKDIHLVYGGGQVGLMGVLADACLEKDGHVTGIIPDFLHHKEIAHPKVKDMHIVASMHDRKMAMAERADAFIAMPGGIGTLEELFEVWTWSQLGRHQKPVGLLNGLGYYDDLLNFLDHMNQEGFVETKHRAMLKVHTDAGILIDMLEDYEFPGTIASLEPHQI